MPVVFKLVFYILAFTTLGTTLLITGMDQVKSKATRCGSAISVELGYQDDVLSGLPPLLQQLSIIIVTMLSLYSLGDVCNFPFVKEVIKLNYLSILFFWCAVLIANAVLGSVLTRAHKMNSLIYFWSAVEWAASVHLFVMSCLRIQWQMAVVILPWFFITVLWDKMETIAHTSPLVAITILCSYLWLLYCAINVGIARIENKLIVYDLGCTLSSLSIFLLLLNDVDNNWTSIVAYGAN